MKKKISIITNTQAVSEKTASSVENAFEAGGYEVVRGFAEDAELIILIGGDGVLLRLIHEHGFPKSNVVGINTGHLGFFQEVAPEEADDFVEAYQNGNYQIQTMNGVEIEVRKGNKVHVETGLNEMVVRGRPGCLIHMDMSIGDSMIETFVGDGILVATPAGSTAYNYSLGGSIVDPRLTLLEVTPIAPMNTTAYRCFTSSIVLPAELPISLVPDKTNSADVQLEFDGFIKHYKDVDCMRVKLSDKELKLVRLNTRDFWTKVKDKYL
ncbi:MAG: NAD(+)/NADH kinase [Eubacteriales bacterium]|nr:NAD(+)/NADH kinase [Eubacteriales bacterium]